MLWTLQVGIEPESFRKALRSECDKSTKPCALGSLMRSGPHPRRTGPSPACRFAFTRSLSRRAKSSHKDRRRAEMGFTPMIGCSCFTRNHGRDSLALEPLVPCLVLITRCQSFQSTLEGKPHHSPIQLMVTELSHCAQSPFWALHIVGTWVQQGP